MPKQGDGPKQPEKKTGPGNPPEEHRWKKGCRSPNPKGRPAKRKAHELHQSLDPYSAMVARIGAMSTGGDNPLQFNELVVRKAYAMLQDKDLPGKERLELIKFLTQLDRSAQETLNAEIQKLLEVALWYRDRYLPAFDAAEKAGKPVPNVLPHPQDIEIYPDARVEIVGPVTPAQQIFVENRVKDLEEFERVITLVSNEGSLDKKSWMTACKAWRKINKMLPPRLQREVPEWTYKS